MDELFYYNPENVEELAGAIGVSAQDTLKYICSNFAMQACEEDYKYFLDDALMEQFKHLRDNCEEFVRAFDYYYPKAQAKKNSL